MTMVMKNSCAPSNISHSLKDPPIQPKLSLYPSNKHNRSFRSIWYSKFSWLDYSIKQDLTFCYYCRHFSGGSNLLDRVRKILQLNRQAHLYIYDCTYFN